MCRCDRPGGQRLLTPRKHKARVSIPWLYTEGGGHQFRVASALILSVTAPVVPMMALLVPLSAA